MKKPVPIHNQLMSKLFIPTYIDSNLIKGPIAMDTAYQAIDVSMQLTESCNLQCSYCYETNKSNKFMSLETGKKFIDLLLSKNDKINIYCDSYKKAGVSLEFFGGEPLLAIDLISELSDYFLHELIRLNHPWSKSYRFNICSNGTLYFDPKVQQYLDKHSKRTSLAISIDGNKALHDKCRVFPNGEGSYDLASAAAKDYFKRTGNMPGNKFTICPENLEHLSEALIHFINEGYIDIYANCVFENVWTLDLAKLLYKELKIVADYLLDNNLEDKIYLSTLDPNQLGALPENYNLNYCGGTGSMLAVDVDGNLYPCSRYSPVSSPSHELLIIGNVDDGIGTTENQQKHLCELCASNRKLSSSEKCYTCPINRGCGNCHALMYELFGDINHKCEFICDTHKARALATIYLQVKTQLKHQQYEKTSLYIPDDWALEIINNKELLMLKDLVKEINSKC